MSTLSLRLPESLHKQLKAVAERDGVSINQFIATAVAEKLSALTTAEYLEESGPGRSRTIRSRAGQGAGCTGGGRGPVAGVRAGWIKMATPPSSRPVPLGTSGQQPVQLGDADRVCGSRRLPRSFTQRK